MGAIFVTVVWGRIWEFRAAIISRSSQKYKEWSLMSEWSVLGMFFGYNEWLLPYSLRYRWYQDPNIDLSAIPSVSLEHCTTETKAESDHTIRPFPVQAGAPFCNPLEKNTSQSSQRPTDTIPMRTIHHECQAAIREITAHIQTREQLDELLTQVDDIAYVPKLICCSRNGRSNN